MKEKIYLIFGLMILFFAFLHIILWRNTCDFFEGFAEMMNNKAKEIGMTNTIFNNPSGLDNTDQGNYSSAYDMAILTRYAMKYEDYREIVKTKKYKLKTNKKSY